jgi:hypothetical protein
MSSADPSSTQPLPLTYLSPSDNPQVIYALETATAYAVGAWWHGLANNGMTPSQRANLDSTSQEYGLRVGGSKTQLVGWNLYVLLLWSLKMCMCHFYSRLTVGLANLELRVKIGYGMIVATYIATMMSILLGCRPFEKNWQIHPDPGSTSSLGTQPVHGEVTFVDQYPQTTANPPYPRLTYT